MLKHILLSIFLFLTSAFSYADDNAFEFTEEDSFDLIAEGFAMKDIDSNMDRMDYQNFLDCEPTSVVNGSVNIISGIYIDVETDFLLPGAEPIALRRNYSSASAQI